MVQWSFSSEKWTKVEQRPPPVLGGGRIIDVVLELPENTHRHILPVLEPFQDFLIKLDMKPRMHLVKISVLSINNVTIRHTKIMKNLLEQLKILIFEVIFQRWKLVESFKKKFYEEYSTWRPTFIEIIFWKFWFLRYFIS